MVCLRNMINGFAKANYLRLALLGGARHAVEKRHVAFDHLLEESGVLLAVAARAGVVGFNQIHLSELNERGLLICLHNILPWKITSYSTRQMKTACPDNQDNPPFAGSDSFSSRHLTIVPPTAEPIGRLRAIAPSSHPRTSCG